MKTASILLLLVASSMVLAGCADLAADKKDAKDAGKDARRLRGEGGFVGSPFGGSVDVNRSIPPKADWARAIDVTHGVDGGLGSGLHSIRELHTGSAGLELVGFDPLVAGKDPTSATTGFIAIDVWSGANQTFAAVTHFVGNGGATIVDITDPTKPKVVSQIDSGMVNSDAQFTDDGKYLILGSYLGVNTPAGQFRDAFRQFPVAGAYDLLADGISIWDLTDKSKPKYVLFSETGTYHNLFTVTINGTYYILQTYSNNIYKFDPMGGGKLIHIAKTSSMVHDMTVARHPITGDWLLYTGKSQGLQIININDPSKPIDLGFWAAEKGATGWHEQEVIHHLVDGRALVIVAGETGGGRSLPYATIDVTDPRNPFLVSTWQIPGNPENPGPVNFYTYSPHELGTWNGYVVTANYHAGIWLFDVGSKERMAKPETLGYYLPHEEPLLKMAPQNPRFAFNPDVWGAYFDERGYIVTADWGSGLYILKFPASNTWTPPSPVTHN